MQARKMPGTIILPEKDNQGIRFNKIKKSPLLV